MALVEVRPLERIKWHGKKDKENFARPITYQVLVNSETQRYDTGLSPEEQQEWSKKLGVDLTDIFILDEPHTFWGSKAAFIVLPNHTKIFDTTKPFDFIKVKNMKASKFIANSMQEYNDGRWPFATHVIYDESEEVAIKAIGAKARKDVYLQSEKMDKDSKIAMILVVRNKNLKGRTDNFIDVEIDSIANDKEDALVFLRYSRMGREEVTIRANVLEMIQKNILNKEGSAILYLGDQIGSNYEDAIEWFRNPDNQKLKISILEKLNR